MVVQVSGGSDEIAAQLAAENGRAAISGWIYDSDFAFLARVGADGRSFELLLGEPYSEDEQAQRELEALASPSGRRSSAEALAAWSKENAPQPARADLLLQSLQQDDVFVEETLARLLAELGLAEVSSLLDTL